MSLRVRFPNGNVIVYPEARYLAYRNDYPAWELYTEKGGKWVASVPTTSGAVVETDQGANATLRRPPAAITLDAAIRTIVEQLKGVGYFDRHKISGLKRNLRRFNCRDGSYK